MWIESGWMSVQKICQLIFALASYANFATGNGHAEDTDLSPMGADDDQIIEQLANMICIHRHLPLCCMALVLMTYRLFLTNMVYSLMCQLTCVTKCCAIMS